MRARRQTILQAYISPARLSLLLSTDGEDDGYLALFTFVPANRASDFVFLDVVRLDIEPSRACLNAFRRVCMDLGFPRCRADSYSVEAER
jgi:hypothetical protein